MKQHQSLYSNQISLPDRTTRMLLKITAFLLLLFCCSQTVYAETSIKLLAVGDNLTHMGIVYSGKMEDGSLNYDFEFEPILELLEKAQIRVINQETPLAGNHLGFSGFPHFNSPTEIADSIEKASFNVVLTATNHTYDQDINGIKSFRDYLTENHSSLFVLGSQTENITQTTTPVSVNALAGSTYYYEYDSLTQCVIPILEIEGIRIAMLNYTYGANTEVIPLELPNYLNFLCKYNPKTGLMDFTRLNMQVIKEISAAEKIADFTIVFPHWGTEYQSVPSSYQKKFARQMTVAGADLIIGTHPHVVQPVEYISICAEREALCFYSLGNYVSTQQQARSMLEALAWVTLKISDDHKVTIDYDNTGAIPMIMEYTKGKVRFQNICFLEDYTQEQCQNSGIQNYSPVTLDNYLSWSEETLGKYILSKKEALR